MLNDLRHQCCQYAFCLFQRALLASQVLDVQPSLSVNHCQRHIQILPQDQIGKVHTIFFSLDTSHP